MKDEQIIELLNKYNDGTLTPDEKTILESWYVKQASNTNLDLSKKEIDRNLEIIRKSLPLANNAVQVTLWSRIISAAAVLIFISLGIYFYSDYSNKPEREYADIDIKNEITPGSNKAILTLADGSRISLTDANNGDIAKQAGIRISKTADGQLMYTISGANSDVLKLVYNTIETPRGGQYQIILPDGTKVWLNSASSLKYPASFVSLKERRVELSGEAYFDVAKDRDHPFIVKTDKQEVKVLGTQFNINTYPDEPAVKTTLLEGSVKLSQLTTHNSQFLKPGQQSVLTDNGISISKVNTEEVIAWKNGYFRFDDEELESIMRKIARWYDVDIIWRDAALKKEPFGAVTTRFANVSSLLNMMEQTGDVEFNVEDGKIIISKKR